MLHIRSRCRSRVSIGLTSCRILLSSSRPNWIPLCAFVALLAFGGGGNLVLDTTVFLEYLPSNKQYVLTLLAAWWGIGQAFAGLMAWAFLPRYSCSPAATCTYDNNMGWRYVFWTCSAVVFVMSALRVTVIRLKVCLASEHNNFNSNQNQETPKFMLAEGRDDIVVETLQGIATKYNRPVL